MSKHELIGAVAAQTGLDRAAVVSTVNALVGVISGALAAGDKVAISGLGTFQTRDRAARTGRNPRSGEAIEIAASRTVAFKPATALRQAVNG